MPKDDVSEGHHDPRQEPFGYVCRRCLNCCHHKRIQLNPYEVARMARNRGVSTTEFRGRWTVEGAGVALSQTPDGACVFLGPEGCGVHPDRPLVCRLYPLGRHVSSDGVERFSRVTPHPRSEGSLTRDGTIAAFLEEQGAGPFIAAADDYLAWMYDALNRVEGAVDAAKSGPSGVDVVEDILDMDAAIAEDCTLSGRPAPADIDDRKRLHLEILYRQTAGDTGSET